MSRHSRRRAELGEDDALYTNAANKSTHRRFPHQAYRRSEYRHNHASTFGDTPKCTATTKYNNTVSYVELVLEVVHGDGNECSRHSPDRVCHIGPRVWSFPFPHLCSAIRRMAKCPPPGHRPNCTKSESESTNADAANANAMMNKCTKVVV